MGESQILLVDDDPRQVSILAAHLAPLGHTICTAGGGADALACLDQHALDLMIVDLHMPEIDGLDVLIHVRARPELDRLPVVLVTSSHEREARLRAVEAGAADFIEKPVDAAVLRARASNLLRLKQLGDSEVIRNLELERLERLRQQLADLLVHDLKAPIAGVALNIEVAMEMLSLTEGPAFDALKDALAGVLRLDSMTAELLLLARLQEAAIPIHPVRCHVLPIVDQAVSTLRRVAERRRTSVEVSVDPGLAVAADPVLLLRVVENLLDNAIRHSPRGGPIVVAARADQGVSLSFANTGTPIPLADRERLFGRFAQVSGAVARGANVGLGLHFCHVVAEAHHGSIRVDHTDAWPVVFTVSLPAG